MADNTEIRRILAVMAHPDDVDFAAAGSVAKWTDADIDVTYCIVTDGEAGGHDRDVSRAEMIDIRRAEQTAAAKQVGVTDLVFLGYSDGRLESNLDLRRDISRVIRQVRPQRVISQSPERNFERIYASHPDHLAAAEATLCAVYPDARNPFAHTELLEREGLEPWSVSDVYMSAGSSPDVFIDITDTVDRKIDALLCHVSQHVDPAATEAMVRAWTATVAQLGKLPDGSFAEAFRRIDTA
jgi:LmbE family N-acetylglucosaminyl deacetylase